LVLPSPSAPSWFWPQAISCPGATRALAEPGMPTAPAGAALASAKSAASEQTAAGSFRADAIAPP
jgi:hypothetical protein